MRVLSPILNQVIYPVLGKTGYLRSRVSTAVVTYHGVLPQGYKSSDAFLDNTLISIDAFRSQLRLLKRDYDVISPQEFRSWIDGLEELPQRAVLLTCDDGLMNNLTVMLPLLQEEKLECLFFVTGASVREEPAMLWYIELYLMMRDAREAAALDWQGIHVPAIKNDPASRRADWQRLMSDLSQFDGEVRKEFLAEAVAWWGLDPAWKTNCLSDSLMWQRFQLLGAAQLKELVQSGMTVGAHTMSHPMLSRQAGELARREIMDSKRELENTLGRELWALAFPYGNSAAVGEREIEFAQEAGYSCAFMNVPGRMNAMRKYSLPRVHITADMSCSMFEANVSGFHEALRRRLRPSSISADSHISAQ